jgi:hypothetical protein
VAVEGLLIPVNSGVDKNEIHVQIDGNQASISAERKREEEEKTGEVVRGAWPLAHPGWRSGGPCVLPASQWSSTRGM